MQALWIIQLGIQLCMLPSVLSEAIAQMSSTQICAHNLKSSHASGVNLATSNTIYSLELNQTKYVAGMPLTVTVRGSRPFIGVILQARHYDSGSPLGTFILTSDPSTINAVSSCGDRNDTVRPWFNTPRTEVTLTWRAPNQDEGTLRFVATIFQDESNILTNVTSASFRLGFAPIDLSSCGSKKGCFRYSESHDDSCNADSCDYLVTYRRSNNQVQFEISAKADWAAIGFSSDDKMGGDDVLMCVRKEPAAEVGHYSNEVAYQAPRKKDDDSILDPEVEVTEDGRISCRFRRMLKIRNDQGINSIDLNNDWYQLYAWGPTTSSGSVMSHYKDSPPTSKFKLTLSPRNNEFSSVPSHTSVSVTLLLIYVTAFHCLLSNLCSFCPYS